MESYGLSHVSLGQLAHAAAHSTSNEQYPVVFFRSCENKVFLHLKMLCGLVGIYSLQQNTKTSISSGMGIRKYFA